MFFPLRSAEKLVINARLVMVPRIADRIGNHRISPQRYSNINLSRMFIQNFKEPSCYLYQKGDIASFYLRTNS